jgi:hypothetical protein
MATSVDVYQAANEAEADALCGFLRENGLDARKCKLEMGAYPGIAYDGWGVVRVPDTEQARAEELIREWNQSLRVNQSDDVDDDDDGPPLPRAQATIDLGSARERALRVLRVGRSIAIYCALAGSLVANYVLYMKLYHPPLVVEGRDGFGNVVSHFTYREGASLPRRHDVFRTDGVHLWSSFDEDEDGLFEVSQLLDGHGRVVEESHDQDRNDVYEVSYGMRDGKRVNRAIDENQNGRYEKLEFPEFKLELLDQNEDGFTERVRCGDKEMEIASLCK